MRVRAAGALLLAPLLAVTYSVTQATDAGTRSPSILRTLFWDAGNRAVQNRGALVVRDVLFGAVLVIGLIAISGPRFSRWLAGLAGIGLIVLYVPWIVYDLSGNLRASRPPDWLLRNYPWYLASRASAILWTVVMAVAVLLALTDRDPRRLDAPVRPEPRQERPPQPATPFGYPAPPGYQPPAPVPPGQQAPVAPGPASPSTYQPDAFPPPAPAPSPSDDDPTRTYPRPPTSVPPPPAYSGDDPTQLQPKVDPDER